MTRLSVPLAWILLAAFLVACGTDVASPRPTSTSPGSTTPSAVQSAAPSATPGIGEVAAAPGSSSRLFAPNPAAIVVAIDAGHGGCLDWGVPDPDGRGPEYSEKAITKAIAEELAGLLEADGVTPVLVRDGDEALAGDLYPELNCEGAPFRDVNGDGITGFGPDVPEATRTRDELQARLDRANLAGADVLVSLHVDSITDASGEPLAIARTETFYTDETPWGVPHTQRLAELVQEGVVRSMNAAASYERQDRGATAHNLYLVAPPLFEPTVARDDPLRQPTRGALMPAILVEIGTITLSAEQELLLSDEGRLAAAEGIFEGLVSWFAERALSARIGPVDVPGGAVPMPVPGDGPPFWAAPIPEGPLHVQLTNTGTGPWPEDTTLVAAWQPTGDPYVYRQPEGAAAPGLAVPALEPGESVIVEIELPGGFEERNVAWISLLSGSGTLADRGSAALQLATEAP